MSMSQKHQDGILTAGGNLEDVDCGPVFTAEDEQKELASLSISDIVKVQADLIGITVSASSLSLSSTNAAASTAGPTYSIPTAIARLNQEMSKLPVTETNAYYHAVEACPQLVGHERKLMFLECDDTNGNAFLAAKKMAKYWETRLVVFGPERCFLPMTLVGAMQDEARNMVNRRIWQLMPMTDSAGRAVLFFCPGRRNFAEYSFREEMRHLWYILETLMEDPGLRRLGYVGVANAQDMQRHHITRLGEALIRDVIDCLPITVRAGHFCHPSKLFYFVIYPIMKYIMPRKTRIRLKLHHGSSDEVLRSLANYCLPRDRLPTELGGNVILDVSQWIMNRLEVEDARERNATILALASAPPGAAAAPSAGEGVASISAPFGAKRPRHDKDAHDGSSASGGAAATAAPSTKTKRPERRGRGKGGGRGMLSDPRMAKAVELKDADASVSLFDALVAGGFVFKKDCELNDWVDTDGITLTQRKNNLCRRIRLRKNQRKVKENSHAEPVGLRPGDPADSALERKGRKVVSTTCTYEKPSWADVSRPSTSSGNVFTVSRTESGTEAGVAEALLGLGEKN